MTDTTRQDAAAVTASGIDPAFRDSDLPLTDRVENLLGQMTLDEKAGLFFHTMITIGEGGELAEADAAFGLPATREFIDDKLMTHFNVLGAAPDAATMARWHNRLQERASATRLGIPVTLSTDPRHSFTDNPGAALLAGAFSEWPEMLGLAAIGDDALVEEFARIARVEYTAVGLRVALHPQIDLATEPRWARQLATFGEDAALTSRLVPAYIRGFQGAELGPDSVATMTKHFPGGGPQKDGEDPHFAYGREQIYPGGQFEHHLKPFEAAFAAGTSQIMPYYGMPVGTDYDEVGFGFNRSVITGLLRERYGFDGIVCTDWGLLTDASIMGQPFPARAWGVEHLSPRERMLMALNAGVDQFGGEACPELLIDLVRSGDVSEDRLDTSARRLLREKFRLGLFDAPFVDVQHADAVVGSPEFREAGERAQRAAITVLTNKGAALPARRGLRLYVEGIDREIAAEYGNIVSAPEDAELAVLRLQAPYEQRETMFENFFHAGSLEFDSTVLDHVAAVAASVPTVVDVFLDRPAILEPIVESTDAVVANFGANPRALLDVLVGDATARGRLPFDVPRSMDAVRASRPDVPFDTEDPLFRFGHGLTL
ncbi:glycoside hydrolase family 3 protein [Microbacterium sp. MPKO10]|uniref:glycoside hydrolase family 3 protein n=1 Tax=Microbacterium sp. MPKO10 TaxID=2989818 RepID=UPI00223563B9|nr:glycoside hydrolase family 3 N-terminal domain-containing protein [Microbacterium sp. MPKO10]MCW4457277.1 glycoside hydrolase family 3 C-terminal domain-containing protein [Microbacterium sp. MPKO10]